jgi:hypothetical protein
MDLRDLYEVQYPAPGAPDVAKRIALKEHLAIDHECGLDRRVERVATSLSRRGFACISGEPRSCPNP